MSIKNITGWALDRACEIDRAYPGFLGALFRASPERRQVVFAYLASCDPVVMLEDEAELGAFLIKSGHDAILCAAYGKVPTGLRSCLARNGDRPHPRRHYRYLAGLMAHEGRAEMRAVVENLDLVTPERLRIARALPTELQVVRLVAALQSVEIARDLACLFRLLITSGVERIALLQALTAIRTMADVRRLASRWSQKVSFPPHPVPAAPGYTPIQTGSGLKEAALRLRNCSRNYIAAIMENRSAFALVNVGTMEAMVHLTRSGGGWELDVVYGSGNCSPDAALEEAANSYLARCGVSPRGARRSEREWACLRRLSGYHDYEFD